MLPVEQLAAEFMRGTELPWQIVGARLVGALVLSGLIGLEREVRHRSAGLRTHMLVGLASALYCILMLDLVERSSTYPDAVRTDPIRIIEAVTSGVAFLAAGMVVFTRGKVHGLTTGAGMWLAAAVGLSCGMGLWLLATVAALLGLIVMRLGTLTERAPGDR